MSRKGVLDNSKPVNKIIHVLDIFPSTSETFVVNHILETLCHDYDAVLLVNNLMDIEFSSQSHLLASNNLMSKAESFNPIIPKNKILRVCKALALALRHIRHLKVFLRTLNAEAFGAKSKSLKLWFQASVFLKYRDEKIFHGHFGICGKILDEMKAIGAIKGQIIVTFYGYDTFSDTNTRPAIQYFYNPLFKSASQIITSSLYLKENLKLLNTPELKIKVNPVGVDTKIFKYKERTYERPLRIITVGRLIKLKGQHLGLEVIKLLTEKGFNVHYTIVGSGEEEQNLKQLVKQLKIEKSVTLFGSANQLMVRDLLYDHHLFLMTSITNDKGRAEGQGLVSAEAQSTGIPVIGFDSGGIPETIENGVTGFIVKEGDIKAMGSAVERLIINPDLIHTMGAKAHSFVEKNFNSSIQSKKLMKIYRQLNY